MVDKSKRDVVNDLMSKGGNLWHLSNYREAELLKKFGYEIW